MLKKMRRRRQVVGEVKGKYEPSFLRGFASIATQWASSTRSTLGLRFLVDFGNQPHSPIPPDSLNNTAGAPLCYHAGAICPSHAAKSRGTSI